MAFRLPAPPRPPGHGPAAGPGPVVVFLPAHDEAATVAAVVARGPRLVGGRRVGRAPGRPRALTRGRAGPVRRGLAAATERGAVAVAFCDADREYDPAELERLV